MIEHEPVFNRINAKGIKIIFLISSNSRSLNNPQTVSTRSSADIIAVSFARLEIEDAFVRGTRVKFTPSGCFDC